MLAVDPGTQALGWARFREYKLVEAGLLRSKSVQGMTREILELGLHEEVVVEYPHAYPGSKVDPNDLIGLALIAGAAGTLGKTVRFVKPQTWKGQVPKEIHHRRILAKLTAEEQERVLLRSVPKSLIHNVNDAVGLGLWAVGRM